MKTLTTSQVVIFHNKIIEETDGSPGIRDLSLIESALNRAFVTFDGKELYEEIVTKISVITHGLITNHGFVDGNKRIGVAMMLILLKLNQISINYTQNELVELGLKVAESTFKAEEICDWIRRHQVK